MINHITLRVSNLEKSKEFFSNALKPLGYKVVVSKESSAGYGIEDKEGVRDFWIRVGDANQTTHSFSCLAFTAENKEAVNDFYKLALESGGKDNGEPGYRTKYHLGYYAAYIIDPDGHNIEAVYDDQSLNA